MRWLPCCADGNGSSAGNGRKRLSDLRRRLRDAAANCRSEGRLRAALELLSGSDEDGDDPSAHAGTFRPMKTWAEVVKTISDVSHNGRVGMDIGGTLVKCALLEVSRPEVECGIPEHFGETGQRHVGLSFDTHFGGKNCRLHFVSGETARLAVVLEASRKIFGGHGEEELRVVATGGGAHRFANSMRQKLNVEMLPFQEMESLVFGLSYLLEFGPPDEVFTFDAAGVMQVTDWPEHPFPCLLVNMGSGVSILRVDSPPELDASSGAAETGSHAGCRFTRLGGTACGGATFLGLAKLLTSATTFEEVLEMAAAGDPKRVNKLVSDIYGVEGSKSLGLPGDLTAAYFGKLVSAPPGVRSVTDERDVAAALLMLVVQESVVLARALAQAVASSTSRLERVNTGGSTAGGAIPIYFVGGFLANNTMAQRIISGTFHRLGNRPPLFLRHADFLGALGALGKAL
eukprot:TRINITY_DN21854_c0_g1_i1.p1 TRINITY_DN21854_c0_g1~~TRINITY_DN21854_c0_g1_i1.p1  ORF type:complete len:458 (-),score=98.77 TRINITY_DN21854_c0_g1_i1:34-1407(-)